MISHEHKCIFVEGPQDSLDKHQGNSWENVEAPLEFVADQTGNGNVLDRIRRTKRPHHGRAVFVSSRRAPERKRTEALQLRNEMSFEQFVDWIDYSSATCVLSSPHRYQLDWSVDPNGNVPADFIGKFERLDGDWAFVAPEARFERRVAASESQSPRPQAVVNLQLSYGSLNWPAFSCASITFPAAS